MGGRFGRGVTARVSAARRPGRQVSTVPHMDVDELVAIDVHEPARGATGNGTASGLRWGSGA